MDRFEDMTVFQVLARTGTISAAATELGLAPSAVSRRLKALEDRLGSQLVQRTTRQLMLTPAGEAYLAGARTILSQLEELEGGLQAGSGVLRGPIRATAPLSFGLIVLPDILDAFMRQHPDVDLDLHLTDARVDLVAEGYDFALRIGQPGSDSLIARRLCPIDLCVCGAPAFLRQHPNLRDPAQIEGLPAGVYTNSPQGNIWGYAAADGKTASVVMRTAFRASNGDLLRELAIRGHGLIMVPRFIVAEALQAGTLTEVLSDVSWPVYHLHAVYPPTAHMPARLRALIDFLAQRLACRT